MNTRPKSTMNISARDQHKTTKNTRFKSKIVYDGHELDTYSNPPRFGDQAKGLAFGAPKSSQASLSTKHKTERKSVMNSHSKTTLTPLANNEIDEGMSMMTNVVFQEESGPGVEVE